MGGIPWHGRMEKKEREGKKEEKTNVGVKAKRGGPFTIKLLTIFAKTYCQKGENSG